jgi:2-methylcitrate dehydratase PrpD
MARLEIAVDGELNARSPGSFPCRIEASCDDGSTLAADVPDPPGLSRHGLDADAVTSKFNAVTAAHLDSGSRMRIFEAAMGLDRSPSCADLTQALADARPG